MTIKTPKFQGTHLWDRLCWAKENLEGKQSDYRIVWEDPDKPEECSKVTVPDPNWLACALQGGILPPVEVYWLLAEDEAKPDFKKHTRGYLLHNTKPVEAMTEEQAIEYLIMKDIPQRVWRNYDKANKPRLVICKKDQLPSTREWRNAWKIDENVVNLEEVKKEADKLMMAKVTKYENEIAELKKELQEVKDDNKKLAQQVEEKDKLNEMRKSGVL